MHEKLLTSLSLIHIYVRNGIANTHLKAYPLAACFEGCCLAHLDNLIDLKISVIFPTDIHGHDAAIFADLGDDLDIFLFILQLNPP